MKKLISLLLALCMVFALCACGNVSEQPLLLATTVTEEKINFKPGVVEGNTYSSEYLGIGCTMPEDWQIFTEDEIAAVMGYTEDLLDENGFDEVFEQGGTICDYMSQGEDGLLSLNIQVAETGNLVSALVYSKTTFPDEKTLKLIYDASLEEGVDTILSESLGLSDMSYEMGTVNFCEEEIPCIRMVGKMPIEGVGDINLYETFVYIIKGRLCYTLTATSFMEDCTDDILGTFAYLEA